MWDSSKCTGSSDPSTGGQPDDSKIILMLLRSPSMTAVEGTTCQAKTDAIDRSIDRSMQTCETLASCD